MHRVLQIIEKEKLITRTPDIKESAKLFYQVAQQFLYAILIISAASFGYLFWGQGEKELGRYAFIAVGIFTFLLIRSIRKGNKIHRRMY